MLTMLRHPIILLISSLAVVVALLPQTVYSAATFTTLISCEDITTSDEETFRVCATYGVTTPSPATDADNVTTYVGGWDYYFNIYAAAAEGMLEGENSEIPPAANANITVHVARTEDDVCNVTVKTNGVETTCTSCTYCGNTTTTNNSADNYSADCTNLMEYGRVVDCESTDILYFPLTSAALPNVTIITDDAAPPPIPTTFNNTSSGGNPAPIPSSSSDSPSNTTSTKSMMLVTMMMIGSLIVLAMV
jgi:hypothetical protein